MGPLATAAIPVIGEIGAALIGGHGQAQANAANAAEAQRNRDFQERMRSTQYQTAVEDMQKAGLNPALAYSQGGAGNLSGATATHQNTAANASASAASAIQAFQSMRKTAAEIRNIEAQTAKTDMESQIGQYTWMDMVRRYNMNNDNWTDVVNAFRADLRARVSNAREQEASARITEFGIPEAAAMASFFKSSLGKLSPYITNATGVLGGLTGIGRLFQRGRSLRRQND